jgi:hypothetical protein
LLGHRYSNPTAATPPGQTVSSSIPDAEAVVGSTLPREPLREERSKPPRPSPGIRQAGGDLALTNLNSPTNSQDLDENRQWARNFPAEALAWLQNARDGKQRFAIAEIVFPQLAQTNAAEAVALAEKSIGGSTNIAALGLMGNLAQQWAGQDEKAASAWALAQPPGDQRDQLVQCIAFVESKSDPAQAAQLISQQIPPGPIQSEAAISVVHQWALQDASAALAWAQSFPPGDLRDRAVNEVKNIIAYSSGSPN